MYNLHENLIASHSDLLFQKRKMRLIISCLRIHMTHDSTSGLSQNDADMYSLPHFYNMYHCGLLFAI